MSRKLKKLLLNLLERKKLLLALLFFVILGLFLPLHSAQAIVPLVAVGIFAAIAAVSAAFLTPFGQMILGATIGNLALALAVFALQIPLLLTNSFLSLSIGILAAVTSPNFILLSYTNPAGNPLLQIGWTLTRDMTNIGFVIVLIIIGLATALKIREYQWQKTLPLLIGIALLINFTPVILGLIVDASNIVMHFFLGDMINLAFVDKIWSGQFSALLSSAEWHQELNVLPFARTLCLIAFGLIGGFTFLVYSLLFILRYIAIWMLVILSPIAFFCYILPATRGMFRMWWNQFIQWSIIGVAAAFFLRLSSQLLLLSWEGKVMRVIDTGEKATAPIAEIMNQLFPYSIGIGFLIVGFFVALSTSAMGATTIITAAQKGVQATTSKTAKWAGKKVERRIEKGLKIPEKAEWLGRWAAGRKIFGVAASPLIGYAKRRREETKEELKDLPFKTQAAMRTAMTGKPVSVSDIVKGLGSREFADKARPDDINLDVLRAMSMKQVTATGDRGSTNLRESIRNQYIINHQAIMDDWRKLRRDGKFKEATNLRDKTRFIMDPNYIT